MPFFNVPNYGGVELWDSGTFSAKTTYTFKAWTPGQFRKVEIMCDIAAFNGGALCQLYGDFVGPAAGSYRSGGMWSSGASTAAAFTRTSNGSPGGLRSLINQDQVNASVQRSITIIAYPLSGRIDAITESFDAPGTSVAETRYQNFTTDTTSVTGFRLDFNGNTVSTDRSGFAVWGWY